MVKKTLKETKEQKVKKEKKKKLALKREKFCRLFASDREFFGNGVQSYIEAFNIDIKKKGQYNVAKVGAHNLLTKTNITTRINELFEARGLNDTFVDKQLEKLLTQDANFGAKIQAIKEYNILKARITNKHELINPVQITIVRGDDKEEDRHISGTGCSVAQGSDKGVE